MIDAKTITRAVESILREGLPGYQVERNPARPDDPWRASARAAWVGVYRGTIEYEAHSVGRLPWLAHIETMIEVQVCDLTSPDACEDRLLEAQKAVLDVLNSNRTLGGTVDMVTGYTVDYETNRQKNIYYEAAIITIRAEARTN